MTGTKTFTVISTEDLEQTSVVLLLGKMDIVDGYIIENKLPI